MHKIVATAAAATDELRKKPTDHDLPNVEMFAKLVHEQISAGLQTFDIEFWGRAAEKLGKTFAGPGADSKIYHWVGDEACTVSVRLAREQSEDDYEKLNACILAFCDAIVANA